MHLFKETFKYLRRSFFVLALFALIPAILMGIFIKPMSFLTFIPDYIFSDIKNFGDIIWLVFNKFIITHFYIVLIIFVSIVISWSIIVAIIEKHLRIGKLKLQSPFKSINSSFFPVLKTVSILFLIILVWYFLQGCILTFLHYIISGIGYPNSLNIILAIFFSVLLFVCVLLLCLQIVLWTPTMLLYGYSFIDACSSSLRLVGKSAGNVFWGLFFPICFIVLIVFILDLFKLNIIINIIIYSCCYLFLIVYLPAFAMVTQFELSQIKIRETVKKN